MPGKNLKTRGSFILLAALIFIVAGGAFGRPVRAVGTQSEIPVLEIRQEMVYITGSARLRNPDSAKDSERTAKKSRLAALKILAFYAEARDLVDNLAPVNREIFLKEFYVSRTGTVSPRGILTDRQFESEGKIFTTLKIEKTAMAEIPITIHSLDEALVRYLKCEIQTIAGFHFCLGHTACGTTLDLFARQQATQFFTRKDVPELALVCQPNNTLDRDSTKPNPLTDIQRYRLAEEIIFRGMVAKNNHNQDDIQTLALVKQALNIYPQSPSALTILSTLLLKRELPALARLAAEKALANDFYANRAATQYTSCLEVEKSPVTDLYKMATANLKEHCKTAKFLETTNQPATTMISLSLGRAFTGPASNHNSKIYQQAEQTFLHDPPAKALPLTIQAVEENPHSPRALNLLGSTYRELGEPLKALPFFWQSLKLQPDSDLAFTNLALCCTDLGLESAAKFYFDRQVVKKSSNAWVNKCRQDFINRLNRNHRNGKTGS